MDYEVRHVERCDNNRVGEAHYCGGFIEIADKFDKDERQSESSKLNTFFHELTHIILDHMGESELSCNEKFVCGFASNLTGAMRSLKYNNIKFKMIYGYIRVSSDKQTIENQRFEINNFCGRENLTIDGWIEETISGTKSYNKRQLGVLLKRIKKDDLIICAELSRLGRNLFMIMEILNICMTKEAKVWTIKDNYRLGDDIQSKVLAFAFGLSAEIERNLISQRTKEALARKKAEGVVLGRPKGRRSAPNKYKLSGKENLIRELIRTGVSKRKIAKICKVDRNTLARYLVIMEDK